MRTGGFYSNSLPVKLAVCLLICVAPFLALADFLLFRQILIYFDFEMQWIPFHQFVHSALRNGQSILWNPYSMLGFPQHGESQVGAFYPLNLLLFWLPSQTYALALSLYLHLAGSMAATYLLARDCRLGKIAALHAAICFGLSGCMFAQFTNYNIVLVAAYLPLKLLLITRYFMRDRAVYLLYFALASAAELLISHVNMSFITSVTAGLYFLLLAVMRNRSRRMARDFGLYAACSLFAIVLAAVQLVPTFEFFTMTERSGGLSYEDMTSYSHGFSQYLAAFFPMMYGMISVEYDGWAFEEHYFYSGVFGILLALFGLLVLLRRRNSRFFAAIGVLGLAALMLSLGLHNPLLDLYRWLVHVPGFNLFRCPARWSLVLALALAIFSGYGLQALIGYMQTRKLIRPALTIVATGLIAPLLVYGLACLEPQTEGSVILEKIMRPLMGDPAWLYSPIDQRLYAVFDHIKPLTYFLSALALLVTVTLLAYRLQARHCASLILFLGLLDLVMVVKPMNPVAPPDVYTQPPPHIAYLQRNAGVYRAVSPEDMPPSISLYAGAFYGVQSITGASALRLNSYILLSQHLSDPEILDYVGVKYEVHPAEGDGYGVDERPGVFPRAFLLEHYWIEDSVEASFNRFLIMDQATRRSSGVVLAESARMLGLESNPPPEGSQDDIRPAHIVAYENGRIEIEGETRAPAFLQLTDMHYPGWEARLNGAEVPVIPLNGVFRGVYIGKPGPFRLEFDYRPRSFRVGACLSLLAVLLWALLWRFAVLRYRTGREQTRLRPPRPKFRLQHVLSRASSHRLPYRNS